MQQGRDACKRIVLIIRVDGVRPRQLCIAILSIWGHRWRRRDQQRIRQIWRQDSLHSNAKPFGTRVSEAKWRYHDDCNRYVQ